MGRCAVVVDGSAGLILAGRRLGVREGLTLALGVQALLEAIDALEEGLEHVCLGASLLGHGIWSEASVCPGGNGQ